MFLLPRRDLWQGFGRSWRGLRSAPNTKSIFPPFSKGSQDKYSGWRHPAGGKRVFSEAELLGWSPTSRFLCKVSVNTWLGFKSFSVFDGGWEQKLWLKLLTDKIRLVDQIFPKCGCLKVQHPRWVNHNGWAMSPRVAGRRTSSPWGCSPGVPKAEQGLLRSSGWPKVRPCMMPRCCTHIWQPFGVSIWAAPLWLFPPIRGLLILFLPVSKILWVPEHNERLW